MGGTRRPARFTLRLLILIAAGLGGWLLLSYVHDDAAHADSGGTEPVTAATEATDPAPDPSETVDGAVSRTKSTVGAATGGSGDQTPGRDRGSSGGASSSGTPSIGDAPAPPRADTPTRTRVPDPRDVASDATRDVTSGATKDVASGVTERVEKPVASVTAGAVGGTGALADTTATLVDSTVPGATAPVTTTVSGLADPLAPTVAAVGRALGGVSGSVISGVAEGPLPAGPLPSDLSASVPPPGGDKVAPGYRGAPITSAAIPAVAGTVRATDVGGPSQARLTASGLTAACPAVAVPARPRSGLESSPQSPPWSPPLPVAPYATVLTSAGSGSGQFLGGLTAVATGTWRPELDSGRLAPAGHRWFTGSGVRPDHPGG